MTPAIASAVDQGRVFRRLRARTARNGLRVTLAAGRARFVTMIGTSLVVAAFTFAASWYLFHQLAVNNIPFKGAIVEGLFDLLFFTLGAMLVFSTGIILYASLFTAPEARYLLTTPARADQIFATKFQAAVVFSSWAFVILGVPIFVAYGVSSGVPWYFYPLLPAFLLGYVLLPGSVSAALCLLLVRYLPKNRKQALIGLGVALLVAGGVWVYRTEKVARQSLMSGGKELDGLIGQFDIARGSLLPSHWMTRGVMAAARSDPAGAVLPLALVWSNGLMLYLGAAWLAGRVYRTAYDRTAGAGRGKKVFGASPLDRVMELFVFYLDKPTRILVVKDFRTFRRDPTQWALLALFGGMMALGALNFRSYYRIDLGQMDRYFISLTNLAGTATLLCAGLSRFVFPLISLEGRKFWILGLMPLSRDQLLRGKFAFAVTGSLVVAETLILATDLMIGLAAHEVALHALTIAVVAVGLSGLNVGLGAYLPNFRETDPSKVVVGFGGTVNMVVGLMFLTCVVGLMAVPYHGAAMARSPLFLANGAGMNVLSSDYLARPAPVPSPSPWLYAGVPVGVALGVVAVWLPLRAGGSALRRMEF